MKKWDWLQKFLYCMMGILGIYIIYKGGSILLKLDGVQKILDTGNVQVTLEDAAMRMYFPGYTAVVENRKSRPWMAVWMEPLVPVYSYMAEVGRQGDRKTEESFDREWAERDTDNTEQTDILSMEKRIIGQEDMTHALLPSDSEEDTVKIAEEAVIQQTESLVNIPNETIPSEEIESSESVTVFSDHISPTLFQQLQDFDYLLNHYYTVDGGTVADAELLNAEHLLAEDLHISQNPDVPQILIYHTHSQEAFADSEEGNPEHTIVGMGEVLAEELRNYGYQVIHDTGVYDLVDGVLDRSAAYDYARNAVQQILEEHPTIEVIIDLHRDGVEGKKFVTEIDGKPTSMIMFFNGISQNEHGEALSWLENPYRQQNLAFSLQMQLKAEEQYPGLTRNIYLKAERFNLHLRPRSLLIEAGTQLNTLEEERNAMAPLANLIQQVLQR